MADEVFQIGFETTGDAEAAAAFEKLKLEQRSMQAQAKTLATQLKTLEAAGQQNTTEFKELSKAYIQAKEAASQMGRQANGIASSLRNQAAAAQETVVSTEAARKASQNAGRQMGMLVNSVSEVGYSFGAAIPGMQTYGTQLAMMGGNAVTFGAALGPVGVALGVVAGLMPVVIGAMNDFGEETEEAAQDQGDLEDAMRRANRRISEQLDLLNRRERQQRLGIRADASLESIMQDDSLGISGADAEAEQRAIQSEIDRLRAERDRLVGNDENGGGEVAIARAALEEAEARQAQAESFDDMRRALADVNEERERAETLEWELWSVEQQLQEQREQQARVVAAGLSADRQIAAVEAEEEDEEDARRERERATRRSGRRRRETAEEREAERKRLQIIQSGMQAEIEIKADGFRRIQEMREQAIEDEAAAENKRKDLLRQIAEDQRREEREAERQAEADRRAAEQERLRLAQEAAAEEKRLAAITGSMWSDIGGTAMSAAGDMFKFVIEGAEGGGDAFLAMLDSFLEATAVQYSIKALAEAMEAVGAAARYDYAAAAQHGVAAGMAVAVAAATGIGAAAIPNVPTTESGARSSGGGQADPTSLGAAGGSGPVNISLALFAPQAVFTEAERGQLMGHGIREARRQFGPGARI